ncbi:MAG: hypothetical protein RR128_05275 [Clostridium sp.]
MISGFSTVTYAATNLDVSTGNVYINASGDYIITGSTNTNTIKVEPNITGVNITLSNVSIDVSAIDYACAFDIGDGASVNVILAEGTTNTFKSGATKAGIKVEAPVGGTAGELVIGGAGTLIAVGGKGISSIYSGSGSGIGSNGIIVGNADKNTIPASGNITINNGIIQATGGLGISYPGSGIGGGGAGSNTDYASNGGNTTIHGGNVTAIGGSTSNSFSGAGIGGGAGIFSGTMGTVLIDGGVVNAISGNGRWVGNGIGYGYGNAGPRSDKASITIKGTATVNVSTPNAYTAYGPIGCDIRGDIAIGGTAVVKAITGQVTVFNSYGAISSQNLSITGTPEIIVLSLNNLANRENEDIVPIYAKSVTSTVPIISGIFQGPLSTTDATDIVISGGRSTNTKTITLPANYASFAATVNSTGRYTATAGTNVLQNTATSLSSYNLSNYINNYNIKAISGPVDQEAPTGLSGTAPTTMAGNDGKILETTKAMEYKLASAEDSTYKACLDGEITGLKAGDYIIRYASKTGFNAGATEVVKVSQYVEKIPPVITGVTGNPTDWTDSSVTLTVTANDAESGLPEQAYSFNGGTTWQSANTKTFDVNTNGIVIKVKDNAGNITTYGPINITKIDKTQPNTPIIVNAVNYTDSKWYNANQIITANFTKTAGCSEKLQYKVDASAWTDGESADVNIEGRHVVSFRVIDTLGRTSEVETVKVNIDKTAPTNAKITIKDKEFTSFLNTITFRLFFKETVGVAITADSNIFGTNKIEYQKVSNASDYNPEGLWTEGSSLSVKPDEKFIVYAKITDNAGNYVIINSDGVIVDATKPALNLTPDTNNWTKNNVNVKVTTTDALSGLKEVTYITDESVPQTGTVSIVNGQGTITLTNEGQYKLTVTAKDNSLNEISESTNIKIDRTIPMITGASNSSSYLIGRVIKLTDNIGEIAEATYKNGTDTETSFKDEALFDKAGNYSLRVMDMAGNSNTLSFEIKVLPGVEDVVYTANCKVIIDSTRDEYISHNDLPEPYKTDIDNEIKALEARYSQLDKEVIEIKTETNTIKEKVEKLPNGVDGLISQEGKITGILSDIGKLTKEQQRILKPEIDLLNSLLYKINTLKDQVKTVYDAETDVTVTGIDGTSFTPNVYLVVTPINEGTDEAKLKSASKGIEDASKYISSLEGKELLLLYDLSLFRDNLKIQPDGMVKVKIRIPEELRNRIGLDIVHIADNGTVTPMNATVEGDYLVFTTTHFSDYAIIGKSKIKEIPKTGSITEIPKTGGVTEIPKTGGVTEIPKTGGVTELPKTGGVVDFNSLIIVGTIFTLIGIVLIKKKVKRT